MNFDVAKYPLDNRVDLDGKTVLYCNELGKGLCIERASGVCVKNGPCVMAPTSSPSSTPTTRPTSSSSPTQGKLLLIYLCNFHVVSNLLLIYICKLHWNLTTMFLCQVIYF